MAETHTAHSSCCKTRTIELNVSGSENMVKMKKTLHVLLALLFLGVVTFSIYWLLSAVWDQLKNVDEKLAIGLVTAATTILVSTLTVVMGRYFERKKDIEASFREKKITIYDDFLREFFNLMESKNNKKQDKMVDFLREWQRKMILWGGQDVLKTYIDWMSKLKSGEPDAKAMWMTEDFFRAIRRDLGHSSSKLPKGAFIHLILRNADLFIAKSKDNPNLTFLELADAEKEFEKVNNKR